MTTPITSRIPDHDIAPLFLNRWSPRSFTGEALDEATLFRLFEAARWAPSANNSQPWRFIYARNGSPSWPVFLDLLNENNRKWAAKASALVVVVSKTTHIKRGETEPTALRNHALDTGAAWAHLALQAELLGWRTHAIGGFDRTKAKAVLAVTEDYKVEVAIAIGKQGLREDLPQELQGREQPTPRRPVRELASEGRFVPA